MSTELKIGSYKAAFNVNVIFDFIRENGYSKLSDIEKLLNFSEDPSIDELERISQLVVFGIYEHQRNNGKEETDVSIRDINNWLFEDMSRIEEVSSKVMECLPKAPQNEAEQEASKKKGQNRKNQTSKK